MTYVIPNEALETWNKLDEAIAADAILSCNGSLAWALGVARHRPFPTPEALFEASDAVWFSLEERDWQQAFDSHPRIGEKKAKAASLQSVKWSAGEQSVALIDSSGQAALAEANQEYEAKFGLIFLICATGKSASEILSSLRTRLNNDPATELHEAVEQQRQITQLRLRKWLSIL